MSFIVKYRPESTSYKSKSNNTHNKMFLVNIEKRYEEITGIRSRIVYHSSSFYFNHKIFSIMKSLLLQ